LALALCCTGGGAAGFFLSRPTYRAVGTIAFAPAEDVLTGQRRAVTPDEVDAAAVAAASRRVVDSAMAGGTWGAANAPADRDAVLAHLSARRVNGSVVRVEYVYGDRRTAEGRLLEILRAFEKFDGDRRESEVRKRLEALRGRQALVIGQIRRTETELLRITDKWGTSDLAKFEDELRRRLVAGGQLLRRGDQVAQAGNPTAAPAPVSNDVELLAEVSRHRLKVDELKSDHARAVADRNEVERRIDGIRMNQTVGSGVVIDTAPHATRDDPRARNAAAGALGAVAVALLVWFAWRVGSGRRRVVDARTAFPLIVAPVRAKVVESAEG
jgi:hypothetical protein